MPEARAVKLMQFGRDVISCFRTKQIDSGSFLGGMLLIGLCGYLLSNFLPISSKAMNNVFYVGCAFPALVWGAMHRSEVLAWLRAGFSLWLFLLLFAMSALLTGDLSGVKAVFYVFLLWLSMFVLHRWDTRAEQWLFSWLAAISVVTICWATSTWVELYQLTSMPQRLFLWGKANPNYMALMIVAAWVWLWEFQLEPKVQHHGNLAYLLGVMVFCLLVAWSTIPFQSRTALMGFGAYLTLKLLMDNRRWYFLGGILAVAVAGWFLKWYVALVGRGLSYRPEIWSDAWQRLTQVCGLLLGCGNDDHVFAGRFAHAHNAYLMILYEHGLLVFLSFGYFALMFFWGGLRHRSRWILIAAVGWVAGLTTTGGVVHSPQPYWIYFWMPTFLAMLECWDCRRKMSAYLPIL
jgi:hypothetical protein